MLDYDVAIRGAPERPIGPFFQRYGVHDEASPKDLRRHDKRCSIAAAYETLQSALVYHAIRAGRRAPPTYMAEMDAPPSQAPYKARPHQLKLPSGRAPCQPVPKRGRIERAYRPHALRSRLISP
eukprot:3407984-Pyramimonas_sp.AAC.1